MPGRGRPAKKETKTEVEKSPKKKTTTKVRALTAKRVTTAPKKKSTGLKGKRPITPYFRFAQEKREGIKATLKEGEKINEKLSELWKSMSEEEKKVYSEAYQNEVEERKTAAAAKAKERSEKMKEVREKKKAEAAEKK